MRVLIAGCGYLGLRFGHRMVEDGHRVTGVRRPHGDVEPMRCAGIEPMLVNLADPAAEFPAAEFWDWVLICVAPSDHGPAAYRETYLSATRNLLTWLRPAPPKRLIFISSTSVYSTSDGSEVDETVAAPGAGETGRVLRETEDLLLDAARTGFPAMILRVAGIYGPGRNRVAAARRGELRVSGEGTRWMNMVHVDDVVSAIGSAFQRAAPGSIYNVSDGAPCTESEFVAWLKSRVEVDTVSEVRPVPVSRRGGNSNKRIAITRIRQELGWSPAYRDFRAGYEEELVRMRGPVPDGTRLPSAPGTGEGKESGRGWNEPDGAGS